MVPVLKPGCKAYYDTFAGLVACVVLFVSGRAACATSSIRVRFQVTEDRGAYRKDEILECSSLWVVPRAAIRRHKYSTTIGHYTVEPADGKPLQDAAQDGRDPQTPQEEVGKDPR